MRIFSYFAILNIIFLSFCIKANDLGSHDFLIHGDRCVNHIEELETKYNIPNKLLFSLAVIESGVSNKLTKSVTPWPWVINYKGKGKYFSSQEEAITAVRRLLRSRETSIDLGCMQINLKHHPRAFASIEDAFNPKNNVEYAAKFLFANYKRHNNWQMAIASYHSSNLTHGLPYAKKVISAWKRFNQNSDLESNFLFAKLDKK